MSHLNLIERYNAANEQLQDAINASDVAKIQESDAEVSTLFDAILSSELVGSKDKEELVNFLLNFISPTRADTPLTKSAKHKIGLLLKQTC